ncbi:MAG: AAA family ATPase, partial [Acetobacteraceae bacterium]|nr:AAA family ATPase [Acetobacteraceae bacterium]
MDALPALLARIADALDRLAPPSPPPPDLGAADGFVWQPEAGRLQPVPEVSGVGLGLLQGI